MTNAFYNWHEDPRLIEICSGQVGGPLMWALATYLITVCGLSLLLPVAILLVMIYPQFRHRIAAVAAVGAMVLEFAFRSELEFSSILSAPLDWVRPLALAMIALACLFIAFQLARHVSRWPATVQRHPVLLAHAGLWAMLAIGKLLPSASLIFKFGPWFVWRCSYLFQLASRGRIARTSFEDHLLYLWPAYGGTSVPYGKGIDYLTRHEANDSSRFVASQLAGIKLLLLAVFWRELLRLMDVMLFGLDSVGNSLLLNWYSPQTNLDMARLGEAIASTTISPKEAWASVLAELVYATVKIAAFGHIVIGCLRLLGFNVFRNTYKPLLAETIVDFWNRIYYYFKEVLVDFFFYPVFLRCTWAGPRLRLFLAVFAAACLGNMYFHMLIDAEQVMSISPAAIWQQWNARLVYCVLLATGIWLSMLRQQKVRRKNMSPSSFGRIRAIAGVWLFFALINIWNVESPGATVATRNDFLLRLFGIA